MPANFRRGPLRPQKFFKPWVDTVVPITIVPASAGLVLTGFAPTVSLPQTVRRATGSLILTGFAPVVTVTTNVWVAPPATVLVLTGFAPIVSTEKLAEGGPYVQEPGWHRRRPLVPERVPVHTQTEPTVAEVEPEPEPVLIVTDNRAAVAVALFASGAIEEGQYAALLAA